MQKDNNFNRQHILLDTNILIASIKQSIGIKVFTDFLSENECTQIIIDAVSFELLGYSKDPSEYKILDNFLKPFIKIPSKNEDVNNAIWLSVLIKHKIPQIRKQISYTDFLIAAQLMKYKKRIILATTNWRDFPDIIFDRIKIMAIDTGKEVLTIAFIQFNQEKYKKIAEDFKKGLELLENKK